jgi:hypothetical protein
MDGSPIVMKKKVVLEQLIGRQGGNITKLNRFMETIDCRLHEYGGNYKGVRRSCFSQSKQAQHSPTRHELPAPEMKFWTNTSNTSMARYKNGSNGGGTGALLLWPLPNVCVPKSKR